MWKQNLVLNGTFTGPGKKIQYYILFIYKIIFLLSLLAILTPQAFSLTELMNFEIPILRERRKSSRTVALNEPLCKTADSGILIKAGIEEFQMTMTFS